MDVRSACETLGVGAGASRLELRRAYARRVRAAHPDTGAGDPRALAAVVAAYRELEVRRPRPPAGRAAPPPPRGSLLDCYA
ncbi:MAG TPA: hypothetical protein VFB42_03170 [Gaiellaceae bacterium]|nr:hypothetical protein [Gaiellaceae bacterium]